MNKLKHALFLKTVMNHGGSKTTASTTGKETCFIDTSTDITFEDLQINGIKTVGVCPS